MAASREVHLSDLPLDVQQAPKAAAEGLPGNDRHAGTAPITWEHALGHGPATPCARARATCCHQALPAFERIMITTTPCATRPAAPRCGPAAGLGPHTLTRKIKELGLESGSRQRARHGRGDNHSDDEDS